MTLSSPKTVSLGVFGIQDFGDRTVARRVNSIAEARNGKEAGDAGRPVCEVSGVLLCLLADPLGAVCGCCMIVAPYRRGAIFAGQS